MKIRLRLVDFFICSVFIVGNFYYWYRYPFKINESTLTGSGYIDTPPALQIGKYVLILLILGFVVLARMLNKTRFAFAKPGPIFAFAYLSITPILYGLVLRQTADFETGIFWIVGFVVVLLYGDGTLNLGTLNKIIKISIYLAIVVDLIQIALFIFVGRLPALAQAGSLNIRFGSYLDDPNNFGILISLMIGFSLAYFKKNKRVVIVFLLAIMLLATQSLTAIAATAATVSIYCLLYLYKRPRSFQRSLLTLIPIGMVVAAIFLFNQAAIFDLLDRFLNMKSGSIDIHVDSLSFVSSLGISTLLGLNPQGVVGESGYVNFLANYGILYLLVYIIVILWAVGKYGRVIYGKKTTRNMLCFSQAAFFYLLTTIFANFNLPLREIFPANLFIPLLVSIGVSQILNLTYANEQKKLLCASTSIADLPEPSMGI